jgi:hypothetical protein
MAAGLHLLGKRHFLNLISIYLIQTLISPFQYVLGLLETRRAQGPGLQHGRLAAIPSLGTFHSCPQKRQQLGFSEP